LARSGRGPGEVLDILSITANEGGGVLLYDQGNNKVVEYDQQLEYKTELSPEPYGGNNITDVYPAAADDKYILLHSSYGYLKEKTKKPQNFLTRYNAASQNYEQATPLQAREYARLIVDGAVRGAAAVPFSPRQLIVNNPYKQTIYIFWTDSGEIAELSADFDTLRTIPVDLPAQSLSSQMSDSLKERYRSEQWKTLQEKLPDQKTPVEDMKVDEQNRFWFELNYRGDTQQWLVMDQEGDPQKIVHLPKESMLTHVSDEHLGLRLEDITFSVYEPVE
jgi:hypothetical protein